MLSPPPGSPSGSSGSYHTLAEEEKEGKGHPQLKVHLFPSTDLPLSHQRHNQPHPSEREGEWRVDVPHALVEETLHSPSSSAEAGRQSRQRSLLSRPSGPGLLRDRHWSSLPPPLQGLCLSLLPLCDVLAVRQTCRRWRRSRAEQLVGLGSLPALTVTAHFDHVDALRSLDSALSAIGPITELTLTEHTTRACEGEEEGEQQRSGCCGDGAHLARRVSRGYPSSWTLNDAVQQLIGVRRRKRGRSALAALRAGLSRSVSSRAGTLRGESQRRSFPLTRLTLSHRADHLPLTITSLSALCFLLPTLQELHITTTEARPAGGAVMDYSASRGYVEALLRPLSQLQLRALSLPSWATLDGLRAVLDGDGHFEKSLCEKLEMRWSDINTDRTFPLTPCGRSLTSLALTAGKRKDLYRGVLDEQLLVLCSHMPSLTSLSLTGFSVLSRAACKMELLPGLTALSIPDCLLLTREMCTHMLPHLPSLTALDLGITPLGIVGMTEIARLVSCCPRLTSLSNLTMWEGVCRELRPLTALTSLSLHCRVADAVDAERPPPFPSVVYNEITTLPDLSALTALSVRFLPRDALERLWCAALPALQSLELHIDFLSYQTDAGGRNCRGVAETAPDHSSASSEDINNVGKSSRARQTVERSIIHPPYVQQFLRPHLLPSLTRLHLASPRLQPRLVHILSAITSLQQLTLEQHQPLLWEAANSAKVEEIAQLNRDPLHCMQDVDLLHLAALPALRRLELIHIPSLTARVLPVLSCLDSVRQLVLRRCDGIRASDVAELMHADAAAEHAVEAQTPSPVSAAVHQPTPRQVLDSLRLDDCLHLSASYTTRLRLQCSRWSALKLVGAELRPYGDPPSAASVAVRCFALTTAQWQMGVQPEREQSQGPEVADVRDASHNPTPAAFLSPSQPLPADSSTSESSHEALGESWRGRRRHPDVVESMWLWCLLLKELLGRWCWQPCWKRLLALPLCARIVVCIGLVLMWSILPAVVVGLCLDSSAPSSSVVACLIFVFTWPPLAYLDAFIRRSIVLGQAFDYQTRLARRRETDSGDIDTGGMDEGGMSAGWTVKSFSKVSLWWCIFMLNSLSLAYNMALFGLAVSRRGASDHGNGGPSNGTVPLPSSSSTGSTFI